MSEQLTPEWHDLTEHPAKEWAKYRVQNEYGDVFDFEKKPAIGKIGFNNPLASGVFVGNFEVIGNWQESLISIDELRDKQKPKQDQSTDANELQYPIYKISKATGIVVKFTDLTVGAVVRQGVDEGDIVGVIGKVCEHFPAHNDDKVWEDWTPTKAEEAVIPESEIPPPQYDPKDVAFQPKHAHYFKQWGSELIDIYAVLDMFDVKDQAIGHAIKKLLMGGNRGYKDTLKDWNEAIDSINRAIQIKKFKEGTDSGK